MEESQVALNEETFRVLNKNAMNFLKKAWDENIRRFGSVFHESAAAVKLFPMPL